MCSDRKAVSRRGGRTAGGFKKAEDLHRTIDTAALIAETACRKCSERVFGQRGCDRFGDASECGQIFGRHLIEQNRQCGTPKCEYPPKRTPAWTMATAKRCLDGEKKKQLLSRAAFRTTRPAAGDRAIGDRLNDEEAGILAALLGKLYKSGHDDG